MTSTLSVKDRKLAALDRVGRPERRQENRQPRERRGARHNELGPPTGTWYGIVGVVVVFVTLGLVMVLSASAVTQANQGNSPYHVFLRQSMWAGLGLIAMAIVARVPYDAWRRFVIPLAVLGVLAMFGPFAPGIGSTVNGARAWIRIGGFGAQPSEFLKFVAIIVTADFLTRRRDVMNHRRMTIYPLAAIAGAGGALCLAQKDLGSGIVLGSIVLAIAWMAGMPFRPLVSLTSLSVLAGTAFILTSQRRIDRFTAFLDPEGNRDHLGYQMYQGFVSMASGGLTGSGIGGSRGKLGYLPYAHSDFIFAIIADELGFIGAATIIVGFVLLVWFGIQTALAAPDRFGMLVAGGVAAWFGVQTLVNLGGVTGLMPVTGLTLPFFSAGGSSLFVSMVAAGLLLSVARRINTSGERRRVETRRA